MSNTTGIHELYEKRRMVLAALLSGFPPETWFKTRGESGKLDNYLKDQIIKALDGCKIKSVEETFEFYTHKYGGRECDELDSILSVYADYGKAIGLSNWGMDFDYKTSKKTNDAAKKAKKILPHEDFEALRELGLKSLYTRKPRKYTGKPWPC
jgi:hypothetical protein